MDKDKRIRKEANRLKKFSKENGVDITKNEAVKSLISRAAFMKLSLEDLEAELNFNGWVEYFRQGKDQEPYERQRPTAATYVSLNGSYQKIIKQLTDLLPKAQKAEQSDGFEEFVYSRNEI